MGTAGQALSGLLEQPFACVDDLADRERIGLHLAKGFAKAGVGSPDGERSGREQFAEIEQDP